jgi:trans-2,3-dihydro-3-hydroxyanthranilate isomerase
MTRMYRFVQVDVFTERPYAGNPLAVVLAADGLNDAEMQAVAREMNLSETTFVLPATRPECAARVRIFTPGLELPFAGHPTIGTAFVLAREGLLPSGASEFSLEEGIGPIPVRFEGDASAPRCIWMRHGEANFGPAVEDRATVAAALGLAESDLLPDAPMLTGSTGVPFLYVPLRDRATVDRARLNPSAVPRTLIGDEANGVFVLAADPGEAAGRVYTRMFGLGELGIGEDPATGSASGPLGAYLLRHGLARPNEQG